MGFRAQADDGGGGADKGGWLDEGWLKRTGEG